MGTPRIGFIGLGVMGKPMALNLLEAGYHLTVYDANQAAVADFLARHHSVSHASTPAGVAALSDIVITMLPSGREVHAVAVGDEGLIKGFAPGSLLLDTSSSEPWVTQETAAELAHAGIAMVDAPVSGAEAGAIAADLVFMVGGDRAAVQRVSPLLEILGKTVFHLGPVGAGHAMKSINNLITAVTFMATAEGLIIGKRYGLDPAVMNEVLNVSTGMSWISRNHISQRILSRRFDDPFKLDLMVKDVNIALKIASMLKMELPLSANAQKLWQEAQSTVPEGSSVSEVVRVLESRLGVLLS